MSQPEPVGPVEVGQASVLARHPDIGRRRRPDGPQLPRAVRQERRPRGPVPPQHRALHADRVDLGRSPAPDAKKALGGRTGHPVPTEAVEMEDGAIRADGEHIGRAAAPHADQRLLRDRLQHRPSATIRLEDRALLSDGECQGVLASAHAPSRETSVTPSFSTCHVSGCTAGTTVIVEMDRTPPAVAVISVVPGATAITRPVVETVATPGCSDSHSTSEPVGMPWSLRARPDRSSAPPTWSHAVAGTTSTEATPSSTGVAGSPSWHAASRAHSRTIGSARR